MHSHNTKETGFTLIELMICILIAMVLLTVALPKYQDYQVRAKYLSAVSQLGADKNAVISTAISNGFSFAKLPEEQLDHDQIQQTFALNDNSGNPYVSFRGGKKESDYDYMLYQFVDKESMNAPEIAPEMVAMAVVINDSGAFSYHCHYYHSAYEWDYDGGDRYVSLNCDANMARSLSSPGSDDTNVATADSDSSASSTGLSGETTGTNTTAGSGSGSNDGGNSDPATSDGNDTPLAGSGADNNDGTDDSASSGKPDCDHGDKVNNGHGNNVDGVDSSNPGQGNKKNDESCSGNQCIDDEKGRKK